MMFKIDNQNALRKIKFFSFYWFFAGLRTFCVELNGSSYQF